MTSYVVDGAGGRMPWSAGRVLAVVAAPLMLLTIVIATPWAVDHIEDQLVVDARNDLTAAGIDPSGLAIDFDYRDGEATGILPEGVDPATAERAVSNSLLRDFNVLAETPDPVASPSDEPAATADPDPDLLGSTDVTASLVDGRVLLAGTVLTESQHRALVAAATTAYGTDGVDDRLEVTGLDAANGGDDARIDALARVIESLSGAVSATLVLDDESLAIQASVSDESAAAEIRAFGGSITAVATTVTVETATPPVQVEVDQLQVELDALADEIRETVVFNTGSSGLSASARATLDKVVDAMTRYPQPVVEVVGHTDDVGDPGRNQTLSEQRAAAVASYLIESGIDAERIRSRGAGDTEPVATNETSAGKAQNRRVALTALASF